MLKKLAVAVRGAEHKSPHHHHTAKLSHKAANMGYDLENHHKARHPGVSVALFLSGSARIAWKQTERVTLGCLNTIFALFSSQEQSGNAELESPPLPLKLRTTLDFSSCHPQSQVTPLICQSNCQGGFPPHPLSLLPVWLTPYGCARGWGAVRS